jgi:hypothetical protein
VVWTIPPVGDQHTFDAMRVRVKVRNDHPQATL